MAVEITGAISPAFNRDTVVRDASQGRRDAPHENKRPESAVVQGTELRSNLDKLEKTYLAFNRKLKFYLNEEIDRVVVKVFDAQTDKLIKEIPPQEIQALVARIQKAIGVFVDEMI